MAPLVTEDRDPADELLAWLALQRISRFGPGRLQRLLEYYSGAAAILEAGPGELQELGLPDPLLRALQRPDWRAAEADRDWLAARDCDFVSWQDADYPALLREIPDPPPGLYLRGDRRCLGAPAVAVVGSRKASPAGRRTARQFSEALGRAGVCVTSGLALGIDTEAHEGALAAGTATVAVLGNGLKTIYPARNRDLARRIADSGALVTEFPPEARPLAANFPRRNRIISGMATGVLVVEAARQSGSLITARHAMEQGREVFAVPGSVHNPMAHGTHALIKQGAKLTETVQDILEELGPLVSLVLDDSHPPDFKQQKSVNLDAAGQLLLDNINDAPVTVDQLIDLTLMSVDEISAKLLDLELQGLIESLAGGAYIRRE